LYLQRDGISEVNGNVGYCVSRVPTTFSVSLQEIRYYTFSMFLPALV